MAIPEASDVVIRDAVEADAPAISRLATHLARKFIAPDCTAEGAELLLRMLTPCHIEGLMGCGTIYWIAGGKTDIAGVIGFMLARAHLYHLFVAESHHRRGVGRRLWEHAIQKCRGDIHTGAVTVNSSRYAVPFYRSLGFVESDPENFRDGVISQPMRLILPEIDERPAPTVC